MRAALRRIPPPLLLALVALVAGAVYEAARCAFLDPYQLGPRTEGTTTTLFAGSWLAIGVLTAVGYGWLRHRVAESARRGVRIAFYASIGGLAAQLFFTGKMIVEFVIQTDPSSRPSWHDWRVESLASCAIAIALAMGLGFAMRRGPWIVVAIMAAVLAHPPWFLTQPIFEHLGWHWIQGAGWRWIAVVSLLSGVPWHVCQIVLLARITREPVVESPRPTNGFAQARRALIGLALSVITLTIVVVVVDTSGSMPSLVGYRAVILAATLLQLAALVAFAWAALSIPRASMGVPVWLLVASATAALCVAGRTVFRAGEMAERYFKYYFDHPDYFGRASHIGLGTEPAYVSAISAQLLIACSIATFLVAIAIAAKRRGLEELRARTMVLVVVFAALSLASLSGQKVIVTTAELSPLGQLILAFVCATFVASVVVAVQCIRRAAEGLGGSAALPVARLR